MVNNYIRTTNRQSWDEENMRKAIEKVKNKEMGFKKAAEIYKVPKTTLKRRFDKYKATDDLEQATVKKLGRFEQIFTKSQEKELALYLKDMESRFYGLTSKDLRRLAYDLAEKNNLSHNFDHETKMAGRCWVENFLKRNPDLSFRKPEATSAARASGFNSVAVNKFFDLLTDLIIKYKFTPERIFNVDETGISTVPKSLPRIVGTKGKKQVGMLTSADRGQLVTVVFCFGADGSYMPPMFIFPRKRMKEELMRDAPRGSWAMCHDSGWIQKDIFTAWFKKFIQFSRSSPDNPVLLLLDGHASHVKNLDVVDLGREHGVHMLSFPPHCTHRLQPLDVGFMKPLSTYYTEAANNWLKMNGQKVITQFQIAGLVNQAFQKAATLTTAYNAFEYTGIWPLNRNRFTEADFLAASTTDIELYDSDKDDERLMVNELQPPSTSGASQSNETNLHDNSRAGQCSATNDEPIIDEPQPSTKADVSQTSGIKSRDVSLSPSLLATHTTSTNDEPIVNEPQPSTKADVSQTSGIISRDVSLSPSLLATNTTSRDLSPKEPQSSTPASTSLPVTDQNKENSDFIVSPKMIMPFPKTSATKRKNIRRGKTAVITSSPYRKELETMHNANEAKRVKKNLNLESNKKTKKDKKRGKKATQKKREKNLKDSGSDEEDEDTECFYCSHLFSESTEGWVQCPICLLWAHCSCAGVDDDDENTRFICERCSPD